MKRNFNQDLIEPYTIQLTDFNSNRSYRRKSPLIVVGGFNQESVMVSNRISRETSLGDVDTATMIVKNLKL